MRLALFALACVLTACGPRHPSGTASSPEEQKYDEVVDRLPQFEDNGWVVSRGQNTNEGDSMLFSGLALYSLPCDKGEPIAAAFEAQLKTGHMVRYPGNTDAVSFDGWVGFYRGVAKRMARCGEVPRWAPLLKSAQLDTLPVQFDYLRKKVLAFAGDGSAPLGIDKDAMITEAAAFARAPIQAKQGCFRVNLALSSLQTIEMLGDSVGGAGRVLFCDAVKGGGIETAEHFCGRSDLMNYLDTFQYDVYIFKHQRCPAWEGPDANGDHEPAVDYLVAYGDLVENL